MQPSGTKVYLLKSYSPSDSFCTFFSESVVASYSTICIKGTIKIKCYRLVIKHKSGMTAKTASHYCM